MLFCDLVDSTRVLSMLGEVVNDELRRDVFAALRAAVMSAGGTEVKNLGDGLMVSFPDAGCALAGADAMLAAVDRLRPRWPSVPLALRIGCSAGEATEEDGDWFGVPVVEAARLCSAAGAGEVLVAAHALDRTTSRFADSLTPVGALDLKGLPVPLESMRLSVPERLPLTWVLPPELDPAWSPPLVGRADEQRRLREAFQRAVGGQLAVAVVCGPPGIGKTRLVAEVAPVFAEQGAIVVRGELIDRRDPMAPLRDSVRWALGGADAINIVGLDDETLDGIAALLASGWVWLPALRGRDTEEAADVVAATISLFRALSSHRPVVMVVDAGPGSPVLAAALHELTQALASCRFLLVVEDHADGSDDDVMRDKLRTVAGADLIELGALTEAELGRLVPGVAGSGDAAGGGGVRALLRESDGVPGRAVEIGRFLEFDIEDPAERVRRASVATCPYKGLLSYDTADADRFVGRDDVIAAVVERFETRPLVAVVGASGSGKSSLVRAGVVPILEHERGSRAAVLTPGIDPVASLEAALRETPEPAVVVVDQLEELFSHGDDETARAVFVDRITALARSGVHLVVTVRGDSYGRLAEYAELADLVELGTVLVGPVTVEEMRHIVEEPARRAGCRLEPGLVDLVVGEIGRDPGGLPLLSHVLLETWRRRKGTLLTTAAYAAAGGARGAIARTADTAYESLDGDDQALVRTLLLRLTELGDGGDDSRRVVALDELLDVHGIDADAARRALEHLVAARLVTLGDGGWVTIAHEALIRNWPRLRGWLEADRESLQTERHLAAAAADWERRGHDDSELYRGERLVAVTEWLDRERPALTTVQRAFVDASTALARATADRQRRTTRRLRRLLVVAAIGVVLALLAGGFAFLQRDNARDQASEAQRQADLALVQRLAAQAVSTMAESRARALNLAVEAYRRRPDLVETRSALLSVLQSEPRFLGHLGVEVSHAVAASPDGLVAFSHGDGVRIWDPETLREVGRVAVAEQDISMGRVALTPDHELLLLRGDGRLDRWDAETGRPFGTGIETGMSGGIIDVDSAGRLAVVSGVDAFVVVDLAADAVVAGPEEVEPGQVHAAPVALARDGSAVVVLRSTADGAEFHVLDPRTLDALRPPVPAPDGVFPRGAMRVAASDGARYAAVAASPAGPEPGFILVDLHDGVASSFGRESEGNIVSFVRTADGEEVVLAVSRLDSQLVTVPDLSVRARVPIGSVGDGSDVVAAGSVLVAGGQPATAWSLDGRTALAEKPLAPGKAWSVSGDGRWLFTYADDNGAVETTLYDTATGRKVRTFPGETDPLEGGLVRWHDLTTNVLHVVDHDGNDRYPPLKLTEPDLYTWNSVHPSGRWAAWVVYGDDEAVARVADMRTGETIFDIELDVPPGWSETANTTPEAVAFSAHGDLLGVGAGGQTLIISVPSGEVITEIEASGSYPLFSGNGERFSLIAGSAVTVYDTRTGEQVGPPLHAANSVAWSSLDEHGRHIAITSRETMQLFDVDSGTRIGPSFPAPPGSFGFLTDDSLILTPDTEVIEIPLEADRWAAAACDAAGSNFSAEEWRRYVSESEPFRPTCPGLPQR